MKYIVIIGAGPAGLTAAYELTKENHDCRVVVLEETQAIGGISRTVRHNGNRMDIGGHRFFSKDERVNEWWQHIFPDQGAPSLDDKILDRDVALAKDGPDPQKEDIVMLLRNRVSRIYYKHKFFDYPVRMNAQTILNMGFITTMQAGLSYLFSCVSKKREDCLENFYINRFGRKLYSMFFEGYTEKLWGRHPSEISADWGSQRVKGLSIRAILKDMIQKLLPGSPKEVETSLIETFRYPKFGPGQLWETVADRVKEQGGEIRMGCRVVGLESTDSRITGVRYEENGETHVLPCDIVMSSMPVKDLVAGMQNVPDDMREIASGLPYRDFVTVGLKLDRLNIQNRTKLKTLNNIVPDCWIYVQDTGVSMGRIQIFNNWSPYMVADPENTIWIGLEYFCAEGDDMWNMSSEQWIAHGVAELRAMGVLAEDVEPQDAHVERVKKAYPAYFDTYSRMDELRTWLDTYENLYCIGRNGQHRYNNMDHSMATSFEAVRCIRENDPDKHGLWNVNTEKSYHESKENKA